MTSFSRFLFTTTGSKGFAEGVPYTPMLNHRPSPSGVAFTGNPNPASAGWGVMGVERRTEIGTVEKKKIRTTMRGMERTLRVSGSELFHGTYPEGPDGDGVFGSVFYELCGSGGTRHDEVLDNIGTGEEVVSDTVQNTIQLACCTDPSVFQFQNHTGAGKFALIIVERVLAVEELQGKTVCEKVSKNKQNKTKPIYVYLDTYCIINFFVIFVCG